MQHIYGTPIRVTSSTLVYTGRGFLFSLLIGTDTVNDPVIAIHDDTDGDTAANEIVPSNTYDATALGINGLVLKFAKNFTTGLYVKIANLGSGSIIIDYRTKGGLFPHGII